MSDKPDFLHPALQSHGLWVGLHASVDLVLAGSTLPTPHCTLLHLGRSGDGNPWWTGAARLVSHLVEVVGSLASRYPVIPARVTGIARLSSSSDPAGDPVVALVGDPRIRRLRDRLADDLAATDVGATPEELLGRYDYTPHVTMRRATRGTTEHLPGGIVWPIVRWTHVGVTCGDAHAQWLLAPS